MSSDEEHSTDATEEANIHRGKGEDESEQSESNGEEEEGEEEEEEEEEEEARPPARPRPVSRKRKGAGSRSGAASRDKEQVETHAISDSDTGGRGVNIPAPVLKAFAMLASAKQQFDAAAAACDPFRTQMGAAKKLMDAAKKVIEHFMNDKSVATLTYGTIKFTKHSKKKTTVNLKRIKLCLSPRAVQDVVKKNTEVATTFKMEAGVS